METQTDHRAIDHDLVKEDATWRGLTCSVDAGFLTEAEANRQFYDWFQASHNVGKIAVAAV